MTDHVMLEAVFSARDRIEKGERVTAKGWRLRPDGRETVAVETADGRFITEISPFKVELAMPLRERPASRMWTTGWVP